MQFSGLLVHFDIFLGWLPCWPPGCFYHNKLKQPIGTLREASQKISGNDLNFRIPQASEDEMGQLCGSFERMRAALEDNNRQMWRSIEDRKQLNAAFFSHDLRTPLTVLRGYADF
ncbi:HAMP domain-containing protein [Paenibacillus rhizoplanae]